jgi:hypothetical protein
MMHAFPDPPRDRLLHQNCCWLLQRDGAGASGDLAGAASRSRRRTVPTDPGALAQAELPGAVGHALPAAGGHARSAGTDRRAIRPAPCATTGGAKSRAAELASRAEAAAPAAAGPAACRPPASLAAPRRMQQLRSKGPQVPAPSAIVTAGVVDDNADFAAYLAFRERTRVAHRPRDVRERYLLEVKDARGRGVADAEVAVHGRRAATRCGPHRCRRPRLAASRMRSTRALSQSYEVLVRKDGREASGRLTRGQKSAVEVVLDTRASRPGAARPGVPGRRDRDRWATRSTS